MQAHCQDEPPAALVQAVRLFNAGHYRACVRSLTPLWNGEREPIRFLYRGLAQAAAGLLHLSRSNTHGAQVKLASAVRSLRPFEPRCLGIDVACLVADLDAVHASVAGLGPAERAVLTPTTPLQVHWVEGGCQRP
ncbi:MAG: DUF309 domain-containing protein [Chloroflexi bacterium]|nr:DUF309 domain-containing protein [Chloroflexota bacterium]